MAFASAAERLKFYKERKKQKVKEQRLQSYHKNKSEDSLLGKKSVEQSKKSDVAVRVEKCRMRKKEMQTKNRQYQAEFKKRRGVIPPNEGNVQKSAFSFKNRMEKCRLVKKIKALLPKSPRIQREILSTVYKPSTPHNDIDVIESEILSNMRVMIGSLKLRRSDDARAAMNILSASLSGENISQTKPLKSKVARKLGLRRSRVVSGCKRRPAFMSSEQATYTETTRKVRNDKLSEEIKKMVYDFWISPENSRPTGNKADIKKKHIGYKTYLRHPTYILMKTQSEIYIEFKEKNSNVTICQTMFERLKPFYVQPMRPKDRQTCCCRKHVEARLLFRRCVEYHRKTGRNDVHFEHLSDLVEATMCDKSASKSYNRLPCIRRTCTDCGVQQVPFFTPVTDDSEEVKWERYEYTVINFKGGSKKKLMLVNKSTTPTEMFSYFKDLIHVFSSHQFSASWQNEQLSFLKNNLPQKHCLVVHDFSENYKCIEKEELQSSYFGKTEVSIHVSVIYRHAVLEYDSQDENTIVSELFFTLSPDSTHDHYFVSEVQSQIKQHLDSIGCVVETMVEFTDGCSSQYKSRTCMGVSTLICQRLGYKKFVRNYFETSHAKGPQDAAGGMLKRQLDNAVMKGNIIQNARDVSMYAGEHLSTPKSGIYVRMIFKYLDNINRESEYTFKAVPENRSIHQLITCSPGKLLVRQQSCYSCDNCIGGTVIDKCENVDMTGPSSAINITGTGRQGTDNIEEDEPIQELISAEDVVAVLAADICEDYYLMKVTRATSTLTSEKKDEWGNTFSNGSSIVEGLYYDRQPEPGNHRYKLIKKRKAMVYSAAVCFIVRHGSRDKLELSEHDHLDIIHAIAGFADAYSLGILAQIKA